MKKSIVSILSLVVFSGFFMPVNAADDGDRKPSWSDHVKNSIEGWTVHVDTRLLESEKVLGDEVLRILAFKLYAITCRVPADRVAKLRDVPIWLDLDHELGPMQYHPSRRWLINHGHDPRMEKCVHIAHARGLLGLMHVNKHPWAVLHELAHAYHDRELGFDHAGVIAAFERARDSGTYKQSLAHTGRRGKHYGMTNHKEYFSECTEAFFGVNDFYPFVRAELKEHDPGMYTLLKEIWGMEK